MSCRFFVDVLPKPQGTARPPNGRRLATLNASRALQAARHLARSRLALRCTHNGRLSHRDAGSTQRREIRRSLPDHGCPRVGQPAIFAIREMIFPSVSAAAMRSACLEPREFPRRSAPARATARTPQVRANNDNIAQARLWSCCHRGPAADGGPAAAPITTPADWITTGDTRWT
jgi:hypothetical protein